MKENLPRKRGRPSKMSLVENEGKAVSQATPPVSPESTPEQKKEENLQEKKERKERKEKQGIQKRKALSGLRERKKPVLKRQDAFMGKAPEELKPPKTADKETQAYSIFYLSPRNVLVLSLCPGCLQESRQSIGIHQDTGKQYITLTMCRGCVRRNRLISYFA